MIVRSLIFALFVLTISGQSMAQRDSTDLNFYAESIEINNTQDSANYLGSDTRLLVLEFEISEIELLGRVFIELHSPASLGSVYKNSFTLAQLEGLGYVVDNYVSIPLGVYGLSSGWEVILYKENLSGLLSPVIRKYLSL